MNAKTSLVISLAAAVVLSVRAGGGNASRPQPALSGNRAPYEIVFAPDGKRAYVSEWSEASVAVIDPAAGRVLRRLPTGGREPTGLALTPDGRTLLVTNSGDGSVGFVSAAEKEAGSKSRVSLPGMPFDVVLSRDGASAFVALTQLDQVAVVDVATREVVARVPVGRRPRSLALSPDGSRVLCANMVGSLSVIDVAGRREVARGPVPAVNLRGVAVSRDGRRAYVTGQRAQNERPTETAVGIWSNQVFGMNVDGGRPRVFDNLWLDMAGEGVADPDGIVIGDNGLMYVGFAGSHQVAAMPVGGGVELVARAAPGAGPRGLALTPDGRQLWVANHLGNSVAILDARTLATVRTISLGAARPDPNLYGRYLFESAYLAKGGQFSCNSCHPDGHTDAISWKFVHVKDGVNERNVRSLRGPLKETLPFRWSGHDTDAEAFVKSEIQGLFQGPELSPAELKAMVAYIQSLPLPPNPYRGSGGVFTPDAVRGRVLFAGRAGCGECHSGPHYGGNGRLANVGTTRADLRLDVPHLAGVYDSAPYLHDGRAATLEEVFTRYNPTGSHGRAHLLAPEELRDLIAFVREL
jgi:YVTN family beta-propeller protein